jgi:hypothetical protein
MILVHKLCQYYDISSGQIEYGCDGLSALNKAFSYVALIAVDKPSYDLLAAIRHQWLYSKIQRKISHVAGHQDDDVPFDTLDRWGKLNAEIDAQAKAFINVAKQNPRHHLTKSEPWSLWYHEKKIVKNIQTSIYEIVYLVEARTFWECKEKVVDPLFECIHRKAVGQAMQSTQRS